MEADFVLTLCVAFQSCMRTMGYEWAWAEDGPVLAAKHHRSARSKTELARASPHLLQKACLFYWFREMWQLVSKRSQGGLIETCFHPNKASCRTVEIHGTDLMARLAGMLHCTACCKRGFYIWQCISVHMGLFPEAKSWCPVKMVIGSGHHLRRNQTSKNEHKYGCVGHACDKLCLGLIILVMYIC